MSIVSVIERLATSNGDELALADAGCSLTWARFRDRLCVYGQYLLGLGVQRGDRLGIAIPDSVDFVVLALAALRLGIVVVPMDWRAKASERDAMIAAFRLRGVVVTRAVA